MTTTKPQLTTATLRDEAAKFAALESDHSEPDLYGVDNGKTIGTYIEQKFRNSLLDRYAFTEGNSGSGIDFPDLGIDGVDVKTTSIKQPQSSCPFKSASQKIYGLGYNLLVFVYDKSDDHAQEVAKLDMKHAIFVESDRTADYITSKGIIDILEKGGNEADLVGFMLERNLPVDEIQAHDLAERILENPPRLGYLTVSNALQWRLNYTRAIKDAGGVEGIYRVY